MSIRSATFHDIVEHCDHLVRRGQRLRPDRQPLVAFDADGTLWGPDVAQMLWTRLIAERALEAPAQAPLARALRVLGVEPQRDPHADFNRLLELSREGRCPEETMVRVMLQGLAGMREDDVYLHSARVVEASGDLAPTQQAQPRRMIEELRSLGFRTVVVSGSPRWTIEVAVRPLGIEPVDIIAGQVAVVDGVLTDGILEPLPWGCGKIQAILRRCGAVPCVCLGNSLGDLAMLRATSHLRILVNPSDDLVIACDELTGATWSMGPPAPAQKHVPRRGSARAAAGPVGDSARATDKPPRRPTART